MKKFYVKPEVSFFEVEAGVLMVTSPGPGFGGDADPNGGADASSKRGDSWNSYEN